MARVTYTTQKAVRVEIRGEPREFPVVPFDDGLVSKFLAWSLEQRIYPVTRGGVSGGGIHVSYYDEADIPAIENWLRSEGVVKT